MDFSFTTFHWYPGILSLLPVFMVKVLGLARVDRPDFPIAGRWFRSGTVEVQTNILDFFPAALTGLHGWQFTVFRAAANKSVNSSITPNDVHFAIRVPDFEAEISRLKGLGSHNYCLTTEDETASKQT